MCSSPASQEVVEHRILTGSRELHLLGFSFACVQMTFAFALVNCLYLVLQGLFSSYFLCPHSAEEGSNRAAWGANGCSQGQPTTHPSKRNNGQNKNKG